MNLQDQLTTIVQDLQYVRVESTLMLGAIVLLLSGLIRKSSLLIKLIYAATILVAFYFNLPVDVIGGVLSGSLFISAFTQSFTGLFLLSGLVLLIYHRPADHSTEFYFLVLSLIAGSVFMMKANNFLVTYLAIELTSFTAYILTNFSFKKPAFEAGIKYLLFGALSSAIMLLGFGLLYGATGEFFWSDLNFQTFRVVENTGFILIVFGLFFKASIFPFHIWVPATYQSAPNDATAIISVVPKLAALVFLQGLFSLFRIENSWVADLFLVLGMLTIIFGVFSAIRQTEARRMISMGAVAHSGFLFPLVLMNLKTAEEAFWWYAVVYALMNLAVFYLLDQFERKNITRLTDYSGLGAKAALVCVSFTILLISLVGLPPLAGFTAKLLLFTSLWEQFQEGSRWIYVNYLIVAVFATVVSLFFYLRIPYHLFLVKQETSRSIEFSFSAKIIATLFSIALLLLFFAPQIVSVMQQLLNSQMP